MDDKSQKLKERYGTSEKGNYSVIDTIGVPHPYCITEKLVAYASDHFYGVLDKRAVEQAEKHGIRCGVRGCTLTFDQHETALLVGCKGPLKEEGTNLAHPELHSYLLKCKPLCEEDHYAGFAFVDTNVATK